MAREGPDWSLVGQVALPALSPGSAGSLREGGEALSFDDLTVDDLRADDVQLDRCRLTRCRLLGPRLRRAHLDACVLEGVQADVLDLADATLRDVAVRRSRIGALLAPGADLFRVSVESTRLDYVNLREASLSAVQFVDCRIGELDLGMARATQVRFRECQVERMVLTEATLSAFDLRGAPLALMDGVDRLRGSVVTPTQLMHLAAALATDMGIDVRPLDD